jgi:copper(I)-binding protein
MRKFQKVSIFSISTVLALSLTSCAAGPNAETRLTNKVTDGNEIVLTENGNNIRVSNLLLVATNDSAAVVVGHIVNRLEENDALISISSNGVPAVITGETVLRANEPLHFEGESANVKAVIPGVNLVVGTNVKLTLGFARAGIVTVNVLVRDQSEIYADITSQPSSL